MSKYFCTVAPAQTNQLYMYVTENKLQVGHALNENA